MYLAAALETFEAYKTSATKCSFSISSLHDGPRRLTVQRKFLHRISMSIGIYSDEGIYSDLFHLLHLRRAGSLQVVRRSFSRLSAVQEIISIKLAEIEKGRNSQAA